ncbi:MAG: hypothetical protein NC211_03655 [Alistipes senegalensis]|nr:hypothetical protein [Oxalobacter formigenes]MCM1280914.1 hypothetical protein [Alistipes senegalensis]
MLDKNTRAAKSFYREVRKFSESAKPWDNNVVWYETRPDEMYDITLVSSRVYGRRDEYLAVMAAAGLDTAYQPLKQKRLALPNDRMLLSIKRRTGFESIASLREDGQPIWAES